MKMFFDWLEGEDCSFDLAVNADASLQQNKYKYLHFFFFYLKVKIISIYFYSFWVCGSTLWLQRNQSFISLYYFLLIFPLIYLYDTVISCLVCYNFLSSAWFCSWRFLLLAFSLEIFYAFFFLKNFFLYSVRSYFWMTFLIPLAIFHSSVPRTTTSFYSVY